MPIVDPEQLEVGDNEEFVDVNTHNNTDYEDSLEHEAQEFELPDKFKGKGVKDVYEAYTQAEKEKSRLGNEIGELRKLADQLLQVQLSEKQKQVTPQAELSEIDFFADPRNAVNSAIENNPLVQQLKQNTIQLEQQKNLATLKNMHPDFVDIASNPEFQEWVGKSKVRQKLLREADANYDVDSADELFSTWKERQQLRKTAEVEAKEKTKRDSEFKAAKTSAGSAADGATKKTFRRADLIRLQIENPSRYMELLPEIRQAYTEGRVK